MDRTKITGIKFMFTIAFFLQSSALLTSLLSNITYEESWVPVILGCIVFVPIIYLFRTLMVTFPGKNLIQMLEEVFGKVLGKTIGILYAWFFVNLTALNLTDLSGFAKITVMEETPNIFLTIFCMVVVVWAVRGGIRVITRYSVLFNFIEFFIVTFSLILLFDQIQLENLFPIFEFPTLKYIQTTHIISTIPLGELVVFLMIAPNVKLTPKEATKYWFWGAGMGIMILLIVLIRDISVLGNAFHLFSLPGLVSLRLINIVEPFTRMEILFAAGLMILLFFKVTILSYITVMTICQIINVKSFRHLAPVIGALIVFYGPTIYPNSIKHIESSRTIEPIIWTFFEIAIPLLILIIAKIKVSSQTKIPQKTSITIPQVFKSQQPIKIEPQISKTFKAKTAKPVPNPSNPKP